MGRINILEPNVFNMIAAGEVVERPSSVVKELVENSIDAGATEVDIYIENGGIRKIQVSDNGIGILKEDMRSAILPHATSKLKEIKDLDSISTLGFRGEALASIASVSELTIISAPQNKNYASKLVVKGGNIEEECEAARNEGTQITVENLFYTTPARLKFLKKDITEKHYIIDTVKSLILANPNISITLRDPEKELINHRAGSLLDAIYSVYDTPTANGLLKINAEQRGLIKVNGYISKKDASKASRTFQTIIVNGRPVQDQTITTAAEKPYQDFLMKRCFPMFVLDILIPFEDVDSNVHPSKVEVRFRDKNAVFSAVYHAVEDTLNNVIINDYKEDEELTNIENLRELEANEDNQEINSFSNPNKYQDFFNKLSDKPILKQERMETSKMFDANDIIRIDSNIEKEIETKSKELEYFDGKIIGQIFDTYIVIELDGKVMLIDQHAAHERILYDKIVEGFKIEYSQPLLIPYKLVTSAQEAEYLEKIKPQLEKFGFEIENNDNTYFINAVPDVISRMNFNKFFSELFKNTLNENDLKFTDIIKESLCQKACKAAIKGGESLNREQIQRVLNTYLDENGNLPKQCPHGRPAIIEFTKEDIEKLFKRIV